MTSFAEWLVQRRACDEAREWAAGRDLQSVWEECPRSDWLLWLLEQLGYRNDRVLRLYACWCARLSWPLLSQGGAARRAVEVAERYAVGEATEDELAAANGAAFASVSASTRHSGWAAAMNAAWATTWLSASGAAFGASSNAAMACAWSARKVSRAAARDAAQQAQANRLYEVVPFAEVQRLYEEVRDDG